MLTYLNDRDREELTTHIQDWVDQIIGLQDDNSSVINMEKIWNSVLLPKQQNYGVYCSGCKVLGIGY